MSPSLSPCSIMYVSSFSSHQFLGVIVCTYAPAENAKVQPGWENFCQSCTWSPLLWQSWQVSILMMSLAGRFGTEVSVKQHCIAVSEN